MDYNLPNSYDKTLKRYQNVNLNKTSVNNDFHNYDDTETNFSIDNGLRYGDMPSEMLMQKFDETNVDFDSYQPLETLDDHWRSTLKDLSAQPTSLESDYRRTDTQSESILNLHHRGTRSVSDVDVHQPEMFLGFHGEEDREPRGGCKGTNPLEPDFKEFTKQNQARLKYLRFTPDASLNVTGLGRSEAKAQADNQKLFRTLRGQLNWFNTSYDGRKNGISMNGGLNPESLVYEQIGLDPADSNYNDMIKQTQTDRRNKTTILSNKLFRNTNAYNQFTTDHVFKVAEYGQNHRRFHPYFPTESAIMQIDTENELAYPEEQNDKMKGKMANLLIGKIIMQRHKAEKEITDCDSVIPIVKRTKAQEREIKSVLNSINTDADSNESMSNIAISTPNITPHTSQVDLSKEDQDKKQSVASLMFKATIGTNDHIKTKMMIANDQDETSSIVSNYGKSTKIKRSKGGKTLKDVIHMTDDGVSLESNKYKSSARKQLQSTVTHVNRDGTEGSDLSKDKHSKTSKRMGTRSRNNDGVTQAKYSDQVYDSARLRTNGSLVGERGANSSIRKSTQNININERF